MTKQIVGLLFYTEPVPVSEFKQSWAIEVEYSDDTADLLEFDTQVEQFEKYNELKELIVEVEDVDNYIWCLFSIYNKYDQPDNNLVAWFKEKPTLELLSGALTNYFGNIEYWSPKYNTSLISAILEGNEIRLNEEDIRLNKIEEGDIL